MSSILKGLTINESLQDDFIELMKSKGYNVKPRGSIEQQKAERDAMLAQRKKDAENRPAPPAPSAEEVASAKEKLAQLERVFDKNYQYSDDHSVWSKNHDIAQQIGSLKKLIARGENQLDEKWSQKYKNSINCSHPKGFSQKAHCAGKKKHNESVEMEDVCPDCGMCQTHGDHEHDHLDEACWKGYHKEGNKKMFGKTYPNCVKNEGVAEGLNEFAPGQGSNGDDGMGYLHALAQAWYTHDLSHLADIARKGGSPTKKIIDAQEAVEKILNRGVHCPDGKVRKYYIDYTANFDGVDMVSHDYYEHSDYGPNDEYVDSRTGKPWSVYDHIEFSDDQLGEGVSEGQRWPDDRNSLSKHDRDIELMNPKDADINWKDKKLATKIKPSITKTTVDRLDKDTTVPNFLKKNAGEDITEVYDEDDECDYCRGTGEGQFDGTSCSHCHGTGVNPQEHDDEDFDIPDDYYEGTDYASQVDQLLNEFAGGMGVGSVAVGPGAMKNPAKTGTLFGGSYSPKSPFKKKSTKKESVIKR